MDPLLRGALAVSLLSLLTRAGELGKPPPGGALANVARTLARGTTRAELAAPCPPGTLPDGQVCVPVPDPDARGQTLLEAQN